MIHTTLIIEPQQVSGYRSLPTPKLNSQLTYLGDIPEIIVHPDAAPTGVEDGRPVTVRSASGAITGTAKLDPTLRRGVVSVPQGYQSANVNRLTSKDEIDLVTGMVRYNGIPVSIHPA